eukprot:CAMPEP_0168224018 /NCGR_PEP_ID=MMETSP0140_2-20121125/11759_1 /TAXON_ID=44445 /ORGANISM="Pseudo-nitzschia australis, Strain 10249 10 AB" /LENGTH=65 /DNA_ID=CAMNT_0008154217 /DNA_START=59 /DNA_END=253 /DNA_ORIENTATION=+
MSCIKIIATNINNVNTSSIVKIIATMACFPPSNTAITPQQTTTGTRTDNDNNDNDNRVVLTNRQL